MIDDLNALLKKIDKAVEDGKIDEEEAKEITALINKLIEEIVSQVKVIDVTEKT